MEPRRGVASRLGIVLLNILAPGLGMLRLGRWQIAITLLGVSLVTLLFVSLGPLVPFLVLALVVSVGLGSAVASMFLSWRAGRLRNPACPPYSRWYAIAGVALAAVATNFLLTDNPHYRSFYTSAESMAPTFPKGDRFIAFMGSLGELRRGDLVLARSPRGEIYIKRVAAIAGDLFAMKDGNVFLNGKIVPQSLVDSDKVKDFVGTVEARKLREQFPGESSSHEIYDLEDSAGDNFDEITIPRGHVFLLGDHRDRSADSRFPAEMSGLDGPVAITKIAGRPVYQSWRSSRPMGTKLYNR